MMRFYCFGNECLEYDSLAKEIISELHIPGIEFIKCDSPDEILLEQEQINILDVVEKIDEVMIINDIGILRDNKISSLHDFDLQFFLKLMKETGQIKKVRIVGIPAKYDKKKLKTKLQEIFTAFSS
jgi:Ni,Fe-hydrogenase maturation factor